jgi:type VI secretion system protein ImpH
MPTPKRRLEPAVIARLFAEPQRFVYFQAMRLVELWLKRHGGVAARNKPRADLVAHWLRFQNSTSFAFPVHQIEALRLDPPMLEHDAGCPQAALDKRHLRAIRMTPTFMGLLGGHGALPLHYTERIAGHIAREKDEGARAFFDTWTNRTLLLFYEAWRKYRIELQYEPGNRDTFLPLVLSLAGVGDPALQQRLEHDGGGQVRDATLGYFAAALQHRPASSVQIARVLAEYFDQPVIAEQFVGAWYGVPPAQQTALGGANAVLGGGALAGARVWQRDLRLRVVIGPLDHQALQAFLPGGLAARALHSLVTMLTGTALEYEVRLVLRAEDVRAVQLAGADAAPNTSVGRLGWDSYMLSRPSTRARGDVRYRVAGM